jgi:virulence-associated protein VapD
MPTPPKIDPMNKTWVIAIDFKLDKLKKYCLEQENKDELECKKELNSYRTQIFNTFYEDIKPFGFKYRMQNSLAFNNSTDATKAFKALSLGIKKSWIKYFIEKIHLFEIDPNSDASDLLELDIDVINKPEWFTDELKKYLKEDNSSDFEEW